MSQSGRVLVVAATRAARATAAGHLAAHGFTVREAADARATMQAALASLPDVILLDAELPLDSGTALLERIKADRRIAHIPVVFISRRTSSADVADGLERGAHDYLRKPVEPSELVARVVAATRMKGLQDRLRAANVQMRHSAGIDGLTGLPNRRTAAEHLDRLVARARRHDLGFALVLADVDNLRAVNDRHGNPAGDEALMSIAGRLHSTCRAGDMLARWGGDELMVLTEEAGRRGAGALAARMSGAVARRPVAAAGHEVELTISVGWSGWSQADDPDALLSRADRALRVAKAAGHGLVRSA